MEVFSVIWRLDNFSYFWQVEMPHEIFSPVFYTTCIGKAPWRLVIFDEKRQISDEENLKHYKLINICLSLPKDLISSPINLFTEVELLLADGSLLRPRKLGTTMNHFEGCREFVLKETLKFQHTILEILPEDVLIIKCKMWSTSISYLKKGECFIRTSATVEKMEIVAEADGVSTLEPGGKLAARVSVSSEKASFTVNIYRSELGHFIINIIGKNLTHLGTCRVLVLDNDGIWEEFGQNCEWGNRRTACELKLNRTFEKFLKYKEKYLQNDIITLKCIVTFICKNTGLKIREEVKYGSNLEKKEESQKPLQTLSNDLFSLYKEGVLCDVKLRAESETFMAHKIVLSTRSPVFKNMLTSDMSNNERDCFDIPNMSGDILRSLLKFIYTDRAEDLDWSKAIDLYTAAYMYKIEALKRICSNFLRNNVEPYRCCDLLLLAHLHQMSDLENFVQNYIASHEKEVYKTHEWKNFMDKHPKLAADTMSKIFCNLLP